MTKRVLEQTTTDDFSETFFFSPEADVIGPLDFNGVTEHKGFILWEASWKFVHFAVSCGQVSLNDGGSRNKTKQ